MSEFVLHPQLEKDCGRIADLKLSLLLRMNTTYYPWFILVPRRSKITEIVDLNPDDGQLLWQEIIQISEMIKQETKPDKINIGALGNLVPQLHIHVIGRYKTDPAWPKPVWGNSPASFFDPGNWEKELSYWQDLVPSRFPALDS